MENQISLSIKLYAKFRIGAPVLYKNTTNSVIAEKYPDTLTFLIRAQKVLKSYFTSNLEEGYPQANFNFYEIFCLRPTSKSGNPLT